LRVIPDAQVEAVLDDVSLIERIRDYFRADVAQPAKNRFDVSLPGVTEGWLSIMPSWRAGKHIGIKIVTAFPGNDRRHLPPVMATYLVLDGCTGEPVAMIDGTALTVRRTACTSALASQYLSRQDSERLLMIGTGAMAAHLIRAHAHVRPICNVLIWNSRAQPAKSLAKHLNRNDFKVDWTEDLEGAVRGADIISSMTMSEVPLVDGNWLQPGQHLDLVGAFSPAMREVNDQALRRSHVFADTREGVLADGGDVAQAIQAGVLTEDDVNGDLFDLCRGETLGRRAYRDITLFKSVGAAAADLAAAKIIVERT